MFAKGVQVVAILYELKTSLCTPLTKKQPDPSAPFPQLLEASQVLKITILCNVVTFILSSIQNKNKNAK